MSLRPLYYFSKVLFNVTIRTYYRTIVVRGEENLCPGKPVVIAMNHPNAFMDPIAFATVVKPEMNFLARGDVFSKGLSPILKGVGIIPIYRLRDSGREGMMKNDETFRKVTEYLKQRRYVIIFAEGISLHGRRIEPLKKGCARMVLGAMETLNESEIRVVPVGMNYQNDPSKFRHRLFIDIGKPILVSEYQEQYAENASKTVNVLTQSIQESMKAAVVHIDDLQNESLVKKIEEIYLEQFLHEHGFRIDNLEEAHQFTKSLVAKINEIHIHTPDTLGVIKNQLDSYLSKLEGLKIRDHLLRNENKKLSEAPSLIFRSIVFVLGVPIWVLGIVTNYVPYAICWKAPGFFTKDIEWFSAIAGVLGSFLFLFYHLGQFAVFGYLTQDYLWLICFVLITLFSGWFCLHFSPFRKKLMGSFRLFRYKRKNAEAKELISEREKIVNTIKRLIGAV